MPNTPDLTIIPCTNVDAIDGISGAKTWTVVIHFQSNYPIFNATSEVNLTT
jgi:hypothetical protein